MIFNKLSSKKHAIKRYAQTGEKVHIKFVEPWFWGGHIHSSAAGIIAENTDTDNCENYHSWQESDFFKLNGKKFLFLAISEIVSYDDFLLSIGISNSKNYAFCPDDLERWTIILAGYNDDLERCYEVEYALDV